MFESIDRRIVPEKGQFIRDFPVVRFFSTRESFVWWWWMFMFREGGIRKQIVAFWTTKTYPDVSVDGEEWGPAAELRGSPQEYSYQGMSTFWYWDGNRFHETGPAVSEFSNSVRDGKLEIRSKDVHHISDRERFFLRFCRDPRDLDLRIESIDPNPPPVSYRRTLITRSMGFDSLKIYHSGFSGSLATQGKERTILGSLYMQNITLNTPALPWLWGVFHKDDGSYLTYFTSFLGPQMFSRSPEVGPWMDNMIRPLNRNLNYTPRGGETEKFGNIRYRLSRDDGGSLEMEVTGTHGKKRLRIRIRTLGRTTYAFERKRFWRNTFFYNEFPSEVLEFEHTDENGEVRREDCSEWTGNCEYSWGLLLN